MGPKRKPDQSPALHPLLDPFIQICLLRKGPQDLPHSRRLLYLALGLYALSGVVLARAYLPMLQSVALGLSDTLLLTLMTGSLLYLQRQQARLVQTLAALAGTGFVIGVTALVPTWWSALVHAGGGEADLPALLLLAVVVWSLVVMGHVLRHALSAPLFVGLLVAVVFYWLALAVQDGLFPIPE